MSFEFGEEIKITLFGQSHSEAIGVVIDGLPAGEKIDLEALQAFLGRRAPGQTPYATSRQEADRPEFLSGLVNGQTCGSPVCAVIRNTNIRPSDYENLRDVPRPGHADFPAWVKYGGHNDIRGGGHFSARLTAPLCVAGGILLQLFSRRGIQIGAHIAEIGGVADVRFDPVTVSPGVLESLGQKSFPVLDDAAGERMREEILKAKAEQDSIGGAVECAILGLPAGFGGPVFDGMENRIAQAVFAVPAVKGIEFGAGFAVSKMRGSQNNDPFVVENGKIKTASNHHGGILGGLTTGMPVVFRAAFKPTPSISRPQRSVRLSRMEEEELVVKGRHDPCVVPRAVPCVISAAAIAVAGVLYHF